MGQLREREQWDPWSIGLARDREQWEYALSEDDKERVYWALLSSMVAEERSTTKFASLVAATDTFPRV